MKLNRYLFFLFLIASGSMFAQEDQDGLFEIKTQNVETKPITYPILKLGGVFQARYIANFKENVDINGLDHADGKSVDNSFEIKRMRVSLSAKISQNLELNTLINLADFKGDPKGKVLENAFAKYNVNKYLQVQLGQFRPVFGIEDSHPVDIVKSIDFSNSYYLMGSNGWQSFQIGISAGGVVDLNKVPMSYSFAITNGNGRNTTDDNNGKHYSGRIQFDLNSKHNFKVGFSGGVGDENLKQVYALGFDLVYKIPLSKDWSLDFQTEGFQATNHALYATELAKLDPALASHLQINDFVLNGFYILPNLRYEIGRNRFQAIEFSMRYEYLDASKKINSNPRQTWVPMVSIEFLKNYGARLQLGMQIDNFKKNVSNSKSYNSNLAFLQFQCRL